ncbi:MAG: hypothetical protein AAFU85_22230 [Planctomycetota bacterium]
MSSRWIDSARDRVFVLTVVWIGFVLAISFMEAPLKFQTPSLTTPVALEIGYLVFHALNGIELAFASVISIATFCAARSEPKHLRAFLIAVLVLLALQTTLLYTKLDQRTASIISGDQVPSAPYHLIYIGMEVAKVFLLMGLAHSQIDHFQSVAACQRSPNQGLDGGNLDETNIRS